MKMTTEQLQAILENHKKWINGEDIGIRANLMRAILSSAYLSCADLSGADLSCADLSGADLSGADLSGADLSCADLSGANLTDAILSSANLSGANLTDANLMRAILSSAKNLLSAINYLDAHFERTDSGYVAYKTFGGQYSPNPEWAITAGSIINEVVNSCRTDNCGCGINVAPLDWVRANYKGDIWRVLIRWEWLPGVIVPYNTDGKIRCERVELVEVVK